MGIVVIWNLSDKPSYYGEMVLDLSMQFLNIDFTLRMIYFEPI